MEKNRITQIQIRATHDEKNEFQNAAKAFNLNISEYIRTLHEKKELPPPPSEVECKQLAALSHIGNLFNELIHLMRTGTIPETTDIALLVEAIGLFTKYMESRR
ncbi:plasmid mobilization protein [Endozoicomonas ascidiicola]|uniref:plasmid mobilization protein n=1 Tax=Endozoicomonas ascidiicola TaxID=1698521 RepID=UPI0008303A71|nr:hypothetical protein [Endozoicomonas ascidiicola]